MEESQKDHSSIIKKEPGDCVPLAKSCVGYDMYIDTRGKTNIKMKHTNLTNISNVIRLLLSGLCFK